MNFKVLTKNCCSPLMKAGPIRCYFFFSRAFLMALSIRDLISRLRSDREAAELGLLLLREGVDFADLDED